MAVGPAEDREHSDRRPEASRGLTGLSVPAGASGLATTLSSPEIRVLDAQRTAGNRAVADVLGHARRIQRAPDDDKPKGPMQSSIFGMQGGPAQDPMAAAIFGEPLVYPQFGGGPSSAPATTTQAPPRRPTNAKDALTTFAGPTDMFAAPIGTEPVESMDYTAVVDELIALNSWASKRRQSFADVEKRRSALGARHRVLLTADRRRKRGGGASKPRSLTQQLDVTKMSRDEMAKELDTIVAYLRTRPSAADLKKLAVPLNALEEALDARRTSEEEAVRRRDIEIALDPPGDNPMQQAGYLLKRIQEIKPDPDDPSRAILRLPGIYIPLSLDHANNLKMSARKSLFGSASNVDSLLNDAYAAFKERKAKNDDQFIVHGLVKWATGVEDLDAPQMLAERDEGLRRLEAVRAKVQGGALTTAYFDTISAHNYASYYARRIGQWESKLISGAMGWVIALTILKEALTIAATGGASALTAFRVARGASLLRTTLTIGAATGTAGFVAGATGSFVSQAIGDGPISGTKALKAGGLGSLEAGSIGVAPGLATAAKRGMGVAEGGVALSRTSRIARTAVAETGANLAVNVPAEIAKGGSVKGVIAGSVIGGTVASGGGVALKEIAGTSKALATAGGAALGLASGYASGRAQGKEGWELALGTVSAGTSGGLGPHLDASNTARLQQRYGPAAAGPAGPPLALPVGGETERPGGAAALAETERPGGVRSSNLEPQGAPPGVAPQLDAPSQPATAKIDAAKVAAESIGSAPAPPLPQREQGRPLLPASILPAEPTPSPRPAYEVATMSEGRGRDPKHDLAAQPGARASQPTEKYADEEPGRYVATGEKPVTGISKSKSYVVKDTTDTTEEGKKYLFKPLAGEHPVERAEERGIRVEEQAPREVAAPLVAEKLGVESAKGLLVTIGKEKGVLIEWKEKNTLKDLALADYPAFTKLVQSEEFREAVTSVDALDYLINNLDRATNFGNYLYEFTPDGKLKLTVIDHGLTFTGTRERADVTGYTRGLPESYSTDLVKKLKDMDKDRAALIERIRPFVGDEAVEGFNHRLDIMLKDMAAKQAPQP